MHQKKRLSNKARNRLSLLIRDGSRFASAHDTTLQRAYDVLVREGYATKEPGSKQKRHYISGQFFSIDGFRYEPTKLGIEVDKRNGYRYWAEVRAWDAIGWDCGRFRVKGGSRLYEAVIYDENREYLKVSAIDEKDGSLVQVDKKVDPKTILLFETPHDLEEARRIIGRPVHP